MNIKNTFCMLAAGLFSSALHASESSLAKALWSDFDGKEHAIFISNYDGEDWSDSSSIYASKHPITSIAMGTTQSGKALLVWTEQIKQKSQLFHQWFSGKTQSWSEAELLSDFGIENIGATIVVDPSDQMHLFWGANPTDLSDIIHMTYADNRWSKPTAIHAPNDVPDIKPTAAINTNSDIVVTWSSYSFDAGQYVERERTIETSQLSAANSTIELNDVIRLEQMKVPNFLPSNANAYIHFPQNEMTQSALLNPRP